MYFGYSMLHSVKERKQKEKELYDQMQKEKKDGMTSGDMTSRPDAGYTDITSGTAAAPVGYSGHGNGYAHPGAPANSATAPAPTYQPAGANPNNPFLPGNQGAQEQWQPMHGQQQQPAAQPAAQRRTDGDGGYERRVRYDDQQFAAQNDPYAARQEYGYQAEADRGGGDGRDTAAAAPAPPPAQPRHEPQPPPQEPRQFQPPERDEWGRKISGGKGGGGYYQ